MRVASNVDLLLNLAGAWLGALMAFALEKAGAIARWSRFRERWFAAHSRGALVLLALWPVALSSASVPLGLGQVLERAEDALAAWLAETPFLQWVPVRDFRAGAVVARRGTAVRDAGVLIPCLLAYSIARSAGRRVALAVSAIGVGVGVSALAALSWWPSHAWAWLTLPVQFGLGTALVVALLLVAVPRRACAALEAAGPGAAPEPAEQRANRRLFRANLQVWEQGRFIRFMGWRSGWAGSGPTRRWSMCCCGCRGGMRKTRIPP